MSKNRNDQIKSLWHAIVTWSRQHKSFDVFSTETSSAAAQLFVFVMMTLFGRIRIDYSDHYPVPKGIRIEYSVHH